MALASCCALAARSTDRWRRRLTMPRHSRMARPKAPRMDPTMMKTLPSGILDCCMKGAFLVGGTDGAGYVGMPPGPVSVGKPVSSSPLVTEEPLVMVDWLVGCEVTDEAVLMVLDEDCFSSGVGEGVDLADGVDLSVVGESLGVAEGVVLALGLGVGVDLLSAGVVFLSSVALSSWARTGDEKRAREPSVVSRSEGPGRYFVGLILGWGCVAGVQKRMHSNDEERPCFR